MELVLVCYKWAEGEEGDGEDERQPIQTQKGQGYRHWPSDPIHYTWYNIQNECVQVQVYKPLQHSSREHLQSFWLWKIKFTG